MPIDPDYAPGDAAPETGIYELLTMMGSPSRTREHIKAGARLPAAPRGWTWRLVRQGRAVGEED
jgi:23S rRNA C2498 (ribose-2'-O)-methylase RlmM